MTRTRREVWGLVADPNDETLRWYAIGVEKMQARPITDHRSWRYQAAIHEYDARVDPLAVAGEPMPPQDEQDTYWTQCQHSSWFFLPWHRMYLHHFESIIRQEIIAANGPADWALPYWNYASGAPDAWRVPPPFRDPLKADGAVNPLYVEQRRLGANAGDEIADDTATNPSEALKDPAFTDESASGAFGGPETGFMHGGGDVIGKLEATPHGDMHVMVGGWTRPVGWMSQFSTAALDPLFWLHHANIDRLWEVWRRRSAAHANPTSEMWSSTEFPFRAVDGNAVVMTPSQVVDTTSASLDYSYDDVSDPIPAGPGLAAGAGARMRTGRSRLVAATAQPFEIGGAEHRAVVPTRTGRAVTAAPAAPGAAAAAAGAAGVPARTFLSFEHLTSHEGAPPYDIYIGLTEGQDPKTQPEKRVGRLSMFGLVETSSQEGPHAGSGLTYSIEITDALDRLRGTPGWDPDNVAVTFVPIAPAPDARVRVGRISLYSQ